MFKKLFLCAIIASPLQAVEWTPVKKPTAKEIIASTVKYIIDNPIKVVAGSLVALNICIHGRQSVVCQGLSWTCKDLPKIVISDTNIAIDTLASLFKDSYKFILS